MSMMTRTSSKSRAWRCNWSIRSNCTSAPPATEALAVIDQVKPDLLLLDVMMPGMTGPELWEEVRAQPEFAALPVVFMTAKAETGYPTNCGTVAHWKVVTKPFDPMTLGADIRRLGGEVAVLANCPHSTQFRPISDSFRHYF
jgi:CheY-like chemotaxis protein